MLVVLHSPLFAYSIRDWCFSSFKMKLIRKIESRDLKEKKNGNRSSKFCASFFHNARNCLDVVAPRVWRTARCDVSITQILTHTLVLIKKSFHVLLGGGSGDWTPRKCTQHSRIRHKKKAIIHIFLLLLAPSGRIICKYGSSLKKMEGDFLTFLDS